MCGQEPLHLSMLRTLYKQLTGALVDCPRYGHHWEDIGFQVCVKALEKMALFYSRTVLRNQSCFLTQPVLKSLYVCLCLVCTCLV